MRSIQLVFFVFIMGWSCSLTAQFRQVMQWTTDGDSYYRIKEGGIVKVDVKTDAESPFITKEQLTPTGGKPLPIQSYSFSTDRKKLLLFTNTEKVWRYNTRGDYWVLDIVSGKLTQVGKKSPAQSLMYAKLSPNGKLVAYGSEHNLFSEDIASGKVTQLTFDGTRKLINGTFDWVYEEEFGARDGFRWSPDGTKIAYWQVNANKIRDFYMINNTDSVYSQIIPVEYPKVGEPPSPVRIGVVNVAGGKTNWMKIDGDPQQHYITRMEWSDAATLIVQQLNRKQQESKLIYCNALSGLTSVFYTEKNNTWIENKNYWNDDDPSGWEWLDNKKAFIWVSEKDGWRHLYKVSSDGKNETLLTKGNYDILNIKSIDESNNLIYFMASPDNATQLYLYSVKMDGKSDAVLLSPATLKGTHDYTISPNAKWARHSFSNYTVLPAREWISLPQHEPVNEAKSIQSTMKVNKSNQVSYTTVTTNDGVTLDAWINAPKNFDSTKKYPVVFYVYGEPGSSTVEDKFGAHKNFLYKGDMSGDGYFQVSVDNRGTPSLKGAAWRKSIYRKIGILNIDDFAAGAQKILEKPYFDKDRVAVWGWSGGAASTLNLLFRYPDVFKTGIAIAAITNELNYDNIYTERFMGLPQENMADFIAGSPITNAKNLKGNLLYIHGTGDDNVHYSNAEDLLNELIKYNKQFQFMAYPNRSHNIDEGEGTSLHLSTLYTKYLKEHCPPGAK